MTDRAPDPRPGASETLVEMARLKGLSDGVVAFALTLLVLEIRVPPGIAAADLPGALRDLGPQALVYLLSFAVIGGAWGSHQRMLGQIARGDGLLVWFTLLSLLPMTLLPACARLLGEFPTEPLAIAVFAGDVIAIQLTAAWLWRHASRHGLVDRTLDSRVVTGIGRRHLVSAFGFGLSIPFGLLNPVISYLLWIAIFALVFTTDWLSWLQASSTTRVSIGLDGATRARISLQHAGGNLHIGAFGGPTLLVEGSSVAVSTSRRTGPTSSRTSVSRSRAGAGS